MFCSGLAAWFRTISWEITCVAGGEAVENYVGKLTLDNMNVRRGLEIVSPLIDDIGN